MALAVQLPMARRACGISQLELAARIGRSRSTVARWESPKNQNCPSASDLMRLSECLGLSIQQLLGTNTGQGEERLLAPAEARLYDIYAGLEANLRIVVVAFLAEHLAALADVGQIIARLMRGTRS